ncbi:MAG: S8 family serine peptidase, partial [Oscillospiraceae bacterium]|nr:S8 family serine peptidase [Oscillospiraceae bacterium]
AYENMFGTSMAAPQITGMAAVVAQYIRENGLEEQTGLSVRQLAQSLLMSTAEPLREEARQLLVCPEAGRRPGQCGRRRHRQLLPDDG